MLADEAVEVFLVIFFLPVLEDIADVGVQQQSLRFQSPFEVVEEGAGLG